MDPLQIPWSKGLGWFTRRWERPRDALLLVAVYMACGALALSLLGVQYKNSLWYVFLAPGLVAVMVHARWTDKVLGARCCIVMVDEENPTVLDLATYHYVYTGLKAAGWEIDADRCSKKSLVMTWPGRDGNNTRRQLRVRFVTKLDICALVRSDEMTDRLRTKELKTLPSRLRKKFLANGIVVVGHSETTWTSDLGAIYAKLGLPHVSPYATSSGLHHMICKQTWKTLRQPAAPTLITLPPDNEKQIHRIRGLIDSEAHKIVLLVTDQSNPHYSESFATGLPLSYAVPHQVSDPGVGIQYCARGLDRQAMGGVTYSIGGHRNLTLHVIPVGPNANEVEVAVDFARCHKAETIVLAGMFSMANEFVKKFSRLPKEERGPDRAIIITDGFVNGQNRIYQMDHFFTLPDHVRIWFTFPHTCLEATEEPKRHSAREVATGLAELQAVTCVDVQEQDSTWLQDPHFGLYLHAGAYCIGRSWSSSACSLWPWKIMAGARKKMANRLVIVGSELSGDDRFYGNLKIEDKVDDALPWYSTFPGPSGYSVLYLEGAPNNPNSWKCKK